MPPLELTQHFVAFLDILGFKEMVESDMKGLNNANLSSSLSAIRVLRNLPRCPRLPDQPVFRFDSHFKAICCGVV